MSTSPSLTAIVLAGGQSSRMGRDKALIPVQGVPLLRRVCEVALQCTPTVYVVTPWVERYQSVVPPTCTLLQEQPLQGETKPHGPLVGFAQGLAHVKTDWALLLACDLPCLEGATLQTWMTELKHSDEAIALLPRAKKGWEPLCGLYRTSCLSRLNTVIGQGERSFQRWLTQEIVKEVTVKNADLLLNCNTPQDLELVDIHPEDIRKRSNQDK